MSGFTPGPWKFVPWHIEEGPSAVRSPEGWLICTTSSDANAILIAAAPDLYAFVQEIALGGYGPEETYNRARALLNKARGIP